MGYVSVDFKPLVLCEKLDGVNWSPGNIT